MAIKVKSQRDYLLTEATVETSDLNSLANILKEAKATGKIVALYNDGGVLSVNIEQKTKIPASETDKVRSLLGIQTKSL